jgi:hypothetical protein
LAQQQLYLECGGDFVLNGNGGLQWATNPWDVIRQNFERFLFTSPALNSVSGQPQPADWIFFPKFGLGASRMVGQVFNSAYINKLQQIVYQGALAASTGNSNVPPVVTVTQGPVPNQLNVRVVITPTNMPAQTLNVTLP